MWDMCMNRVLQIMEKLSINQLLEVWKKISSFFNNAKRMAYIPLTATLLLAAMALKPEQAQAQCCWVGYTMIGWWVSYESTRDDYYANKDNGRTRDGVWYHLSVKWQHGHMRYEITWATAEHEKWQDDDNRYKAYFPRLWWGIWYAPLDAEEVLVIYGQINGGWIRTIMKWSRQFQWSSNAVNWKTFNYSQLNAYVWWTLWLELNVSERFKIAATGNVLMIPNGKLDNIQWWAVKSDFIWWWQLGFYFIMN